MYLPPQFAETDETVLRELITAHPLGLLVSASGTGMLANPIPFLVSEKDGVTCFAPICPKPMSNGAISGMARMCWWCSRAQTPM